MRLLHVMANPKPEAESASKRLSGAFFDALPESVQVTEIDLYEDQPPFLDYDAYRNFWYPVFEPSYEPSASERAATEYAARHARMFNQADAVVITAPMWNFGVPAILKAWIDQIAMPGLTFELGPEGVKSLHHVSRLVVLIASGGAYEAENATRDALTPMLRAAFGFIHVRDMDVIWANGQNPFFFNDSEDRLQRAKEQARVMARSFS